MGNWGELISRLPLACSAEMVMAVAPPAPTTDPNVRSTVPHCNCTVWSVPNRTLLVIDTVAVAASPPSVSSVTLLLDESRSVKLHAGVAVVSVTDAAVPSPCPFSARTSNVYWVPGLRPVTVWLIVDVALPAIAAKVPPALEAFDVAHLVTRDGVAVVPRRIPGEHHPVGVHPRRRPRNGVRGRSEVPRRLRGFDGSVVRDHLVREPGGVVAGFVLDRVRARLGVGQSDRFSGSRR